MAQGQAKASARAANRRPCVMQGRVIVLPQMTHQRTARQQQPTTRSHLDDGDGRARRHGAELAVWAPALGQLTRCFKLDGVTSIGDASTPVRFGSTLRSNTASDNLRVLGR